MNTENVPAPDEGAQPQKSRKKRTVWIAGCIVAALAIAGVVVTPLVMQQQRDQAWQSARAELKQTLGKSAGLQDELDAALALSSLQHTEAAAFVKSVAEFGKTTAPIFTAEQAKSLTKSATAASKALGDAPEKSDARTAAVKQVEAEVKKLRDADAAAAAKAKKAKEDAPKKTAPGYFLSLNVADVEGLAPKTESEDFDLGRKPENVTDQDVTAEQKALATAKKELSALRELVDAEGELSARYTEAVAGTLPALVEVSEGAPKQAKAVAAATPKAAAAVKTVTASAKTVEELAGDKAVTALALKGKLSEYVAAAKAAQQAQADQDAADAAAAAAAAGEPVWDGSGEPVWTGNGTGADTGWNGGNGGGNYDTGWNNTGGGGEQTWTPPADTGTGGGGGDTWTPPVDPGTGGGGGSSSGGGGGGGGGGTTPATSCPPGTYPTGSWDNITGVHCLANGTDEGW